MRTARSAQALASKQGMLWAVTIRFNPWWEYGIDALQVMGYIPKVSGVMARWPVILVDQVSWCQIHNENWGPYIHKANICGVHSGELDKQKKVYQSI